MNTFFRQAVLSVVALSTLLATCVSPALAELRWEAEDCVVNRDAYRENSQADNLWNLWSTDKDAEKKWSGGVTLQSPVVMADREQPQDGAPPLHLHIGDLPPGRYVLSMKTGRVLGFSLDGKSWRRWQADDSLQVDVGTSGLQWWIDDRYAMAEKEQRGAGYLDTISLVALPQGRKVNGWAKTRPVEKMDRGVVSMPVEGGTRLSWRLLASDGNDATFDVFRVQGGTLHKLNREPIRNTTDYVDTTHEAATSQYLVTKSGDKLSASRAEALPLVGGLPCRTIRLRDEKATVQKVGIADLNGDGVYDFVLKTPNANIDPWHKYWNPSPETYKVSAYLADGTFLWENDLGWAIERGIWYSPIITYDLDGDGRAEVMAKTGNGDPRDTDGRVTSGPEWLTVWDGMTGKELAKAPWPSRDAFPDYNRASRNQLAVAYLDGKTPCIIALRGTYGVMLAEAYQFHGGRLEALWKYDSRPYGRRYQGQGAHFTLAHDVDGDGRDEVILGSAVLDDDGTPLWTTGKGHPDAAYLADIDPQRPGLEIAYVMETRQQTGGLCVADASTGTLLWELQEPTQHVHSKGLCADIFPEHPGMELYGHDAEDHKLTGRCWLFTAAGKLLEVGNRCNSRGWGFRRSTVYWDADPQKELLTQYVHKPDLDRLSPNWPGRTLLCADLLGDWREEIVVTEPGVLRIYSTPLPAKDRRVCLMQDRLYRLGTAMNAMGYDQDATLSYRFE
jgi:rhamnogalacturonan endolyase